MYFVYPCVIFTQLKVVMVVEFHMPEEAHFALQGVYYIFAVITCLGRSWIFRFQSTHKVSQGVCQSLCPFRVWHFLLFQGHRKKKETSCIFVQTETQRTPLLYLRLVANLRCVGSLDPDVAQESCEYQPCLCSCNQ